MPDYSYKHLVIVHGIGKHAPNETALTFMNEFTRNLPHDGRFRVEVDNLIQSVDPIMHQEQVEPGVKPADFRPSFVRLNEYVDDSAKKLKTVHVIGFSEVYWTPITAGYRAKNDGPPIPIYTWARSVGTRVLGPVYYKKLWTDAINNLDSLLGVLARAAFLYKKSGELVDVLNTFLGDVQMYAESDDLRHQINDVFLGVLSRVPAFIESAAEQIRAGSKYAKPEHFEHPRIYIVAHSEGTVVSLNSLVEAAIMMQDPATYDPYQYEDLYIREDKLIESTPKASRSSVWLPMIAGFATLGSPIDKHYTIWKSHFRTDRIADFPLGQNKRIPWFNFWDQSDPVGYGLASVFPRREPGDPPSDAERLFNVRFDNGFVRYPLPGKAHVDYWNDQSIFLKIMHEMMELPGGGRHHFPVRGKWWRFLMPWGDYLAYIAVRLLAAAIIFVFLNLLVGGVAALQPYGLAVYRIMHAPATPFVQWASDLLAIPWGRWLLLLAVIVEIVNAIWKPKERSSDPDGWIRRRMNWSDGISVARLAIVSVFAAYVLLIVRNKLDDAQIEFDAAVWMVALMLAAKVVLELCAMAGSAVVTSLARLLLALFTIGWVVAAAALALTFPLQIGPPAIKDAAGYAMGLAGGILLWQIHTRVHKGLVQMWRYTIDQDTRVIPE